MEHCRAIKEEELYREVEQRRIHLEQPTLECKTHYERRNADGVKTKVTDHNTRSVTVHNTRQVLEENT